MKRLLMITACLGTTCLVLGACGGSGSGSSQNNERVDDNERIVPIETQYSELEKTHVSSNTLRQASALELEQHLKNGLRLSVNFGENPHTEFYSADQGDLARSTADTYSETNVHVAGVDESDYLKYDGQHIFITTAPYIPRDSDRVNANIRIMESDPVNAGIAEISNIELSEEDYASLSELYLVKDDGGNTTDIASLRNTYQYLLNAPDTNASSPQAMTILPVNRREIQLTTYNVETPEQPELSFSLDIDGYLLNSRKIGNMLYLVSSYYPDFYNFSYWVEDNDEAAENEQRIEDTHVNQMLPHYRINGGEERVLFNPDNCLVPSDLEENHGYLTLSSIIAIDLASKELVSSQCINANINGIYASTDNIYLGASDNTAGNGVDMINFTSNDFTVMHKFSLSDDLRYISTGTVPGRLGWQDPASRVSEYNDHLRIVTTSFDDEWNPVHYLSILQDSDQSDQHQMQLVAQLPNETNSDPIGKPGEDIYAVRFQDDKAFIVTFERIDPLYVIDLSDEQNPLIAGELEVPGFSTYLHPVGENYLLGFGSVFDNASNSRQVKLSLYDISDSTAPTLVNDILIGDDYSRSNALYDLRALSFLQSSNDQLRLGIPVWHSLAVDLQDNTQENSLHLFEINGLATDSASLVEAGKITPDGTDHPYGYWYGSYNRSVLHDDAVYFSIGNGEVWSSFWSSPSAATGPH